jgi:glycosyltransferase involved in cell wall biosynthesis
MDGLLVENGNVSQLAGKIIYMIEHPEERIRMGANAVNKSARYKIDRLAKDWQQLFESL